jgi:cysteinyl-tRNA synthetase
MNITDVEDKIIQRLNASPEKITLAIILPFTRRHFSRISTSLIAPAQHYTAGH